MKWATRYCDEGVAGMLDRSSAPHRLGPVAIADQLGMQASTVHAVLVRCRLNRLSHLDRVTGGLTEWWACPPLRPASSYVRRCRVSSRLDW